MSVPSSMPHPEGCGGLAYIRPEHHGPLSLTTCLHSLSGTKKQSKAKLAVQRTMGASGHTRVSLTLPSKDDNPLGPMRSHSDSWLRSQVQSEICITIPRTTTQGQSGPWVSSKSRVQHTQPCLHIPTKESSVTPHVPVLGPDISSPQWHLGDHSCLPGTFTFLLVTLVSSCQGNFAGQLVNSPKSQLWDPTVKSPLGQPSEHATAHFMMPHKVGHGGYHSLHAGRAPSPVSPVHPTRPLHVSREATIFTRDVPLDHACVCDGWSQVRREVLPRASGPGQLQ